MESKVEKQAHEEKQPYETPRLIQHGSAEQLTGMAVSGFGDDRE